MERRLGERSEKSAGIEAWILAIPILVIYLFLRQRVFFQFDGIPIVMGLRDGTSFQTHHFLHAPLLRFLAWLLSPLGLTPFTVAGVYSAIGMAVAVPALHFFFRAFGLSRQRAILGCIAVSMLPCVLFFATVIEYHGPFFGVAAWALGLAASLRNRPGTLRAACVGVLTYFAYLMHGSGALLPALFLPIAFARTSVDCQRGWRRLYPFAIATTVLAILIACTPILFSFFLPSDPTDEALSFVSAYFEHFDASQFFPRILSEWLLAFLPFSFLALLAFLPKRTRALATTLHVSILPYLILCLLLIANNPQRGAYLLPFAPLAVLPAVQLLPPSRILLATLLAGIFAVFGILRHEAEEAPHYLRFAQDLQALPAGPKRTLLTLDNRDVGMTLACNAPLDFLPIGHADYLRELAKNLDGFGMVLRQLLRGGRMVLLSSSSREILEGKSGEDGKKLLVYLQSEFRFLQPLPGTAMLFRLRSRD